MTVVDIDFVATYDLRGEKRLAAKVEEPTADTQSGTYSFPLVGWAVGTEVPVVNVEITQRMGMVKRLPVRIGRAGVAEAQKSTVQGDRVGFSTGISVLGLPPKFELFISAVLENNRRIPFGVIRGTRQPLYGSPDAQLQPILVTTQGRTGSTWVVHLLDQHPGIVAHPPFGFEPRVVTQWMEVLTSLSEPSAYLGAIAPGGTLSSERWWLGDEPRPEPLPNPDPKIQQLLGRHGVQTLATYCQGRIEEFYSTVARDIRRKRAPKYVIEKGVPRASSLWRVIQELYPRSREIFLVRDPRDRFCSVLAFNEKRNRPAFGRERVDSDEAYLETVRDAAVAFVRQYQSRGDFGIWLRYEDLVLEPVETLRSLLDELELDASTSQVKKMMERAAEELPGMAAHRTTSDARSSVGRWRRDLDPSLQSKCEEVFSGVLDDLGYGDFADGGGPVPGEAPAEVGT